MSVFLQPLQTVTVGSGGAGSVTFNNIPQGFTDLKVVYSSRNNIAGLGTGYAICGLQFNGSTTSNMSFTYLAGTGAGAFTGRATSQNNGWVGLVDHADNTASTFANGEIYISNYTSSNYKSWIGDSVSEGNATYLYQMLVAGLIPITSAVTSLSILSGSGNFVQYSTFALYGVLRQGI